MKTIRTKPEAIAAAARVKKLTKEFNTLKAALKKMDSEQTKAEKRMKALSGNSKQLVEAKRVVKTLNTAWLKGAEKKAGIKKRLLENHHAIMDYKKRNP